MPLQNRSISSSQALSAMAPIIDQTRPADQ
jgi:hypothetical protein